jgi:hypothetical protein
VGHLWGVGNTFSQTEIGDLKVELVVNHDIGWVEVPVDDLLLIVHVPQHWQQTYKQFPNQRLLKILSFLTLIPDQLRQIRPFHHLHDNIKIPVLNKGLIELDDIGVLELLVNLDLAELLVDLLTGHLGDLEAFQSVLVVTFFCKVDTPEGSLADFLDEAVAADYLQFEVFVADDFGKFLVFILYV